MLERIATLRELEEWWSIDDVMDANDLLDLKHEAEKRYIEQQQKRQRPGR